MKALREPIVLQRMVLTLIFNAIESPCTDIFQKVDFYQVKVKPWCLRHPCLTQCCPAWKGPYCFRRGACSKFWSWQHPNLCLWNSIWVLLWSRVSHLPLLDQGRACREAKPWAEAMGWAWASLWATAAATCWAWARPNYGHPCQHSRTESTEGFQCLITGAEVLENWDLSLQQVLLLAPSVFPCPYTDPE